MPTAGGWRLEVVEQREVGAIATGATPVRLRAQASGAHTARPSHRPRKRAGVHGARRSPRASRMPSSRRLVEVLTTADSRSARESACSVRTCGDASRRGRRRVPYGATDPSSSTTATTSTGEVDEHRLGRIYECRTEEPLFSTSVRTRGTTRRTHSSEARYGSSPSSRRTPTPSCSRGASSRRRTQPAVELERVAVGPRAGDAELHVMKGRGTRPRPPENWPTRSGNAARARRATLRRPRAHRFGETGRRARRRQAEHRRGRVRCRPRHTDRGLEHGRRGIVATHPWAPCRDSEIRVILPTQAHEGRERPPADAPHAARIIASSRSTKRSQVSVASTVFRARAPSERACHSSRSTPATARWKPSASPGSASGSCRRPRARSRGDRPRACDDHGLRERHRLQQDSRRPRVAVVETGSRRRGPPRAVVASRRKGCRPRRRRSAERSERACALGGRHEPKRPARQAAATERNSSKSRCGSAPAMTTSSIGASADGTNACASTPKGTNSTPVDRRGSHEGIECAASCSLYARTEDAEASAVATGAASAPIEPLETLGKPDRDVDERRANAPAPRTAGAGSPRCRPSRGRRRHDSPPVETRARSRSRRRSPRPLERRLESVPARARPGRRRARPLEVMASRPAALDELIEAEEEVPLGGARRRRERPPALRRVAIGVEDRLHRGGGKVGHRTPGGVARRCTGNGHSSHAA